MIDISIKTKEEQEKMRAGGKISARVLEILKKSIKPGITTKELDKIAEYEIIQAGGKPAFKGHGGYPATICASVNSEIVHGIPSSRKIKDGDIVGIDIGTLYKGFFTDTAITVPVGKISKNAQRLINITRQSLENGIAAIKPGVRLGDIQEVIQKTIEDAGFGVIRDYSGHGVGKELQEDPPIQNFGKKGTGPILREGMTLAIEPMVSFGDWHIKIADDGWTALISDGSLGAHFEHTILVTPKGAEILTKA